MKIFIAGASGAIGSHLVPQLVARGHEVVGTTRSAAKTGALRALGAEPVIVDALDPDAVADVVAKAEPEVIVHQLTALSGPANFRHAKRMAAPPTGCGPRAPITCWRPGAPSASARSWRRATRSGWNAPAGRSSTRTAGSSRTRPRTPWRWWRRCATWRTR